MHHMKGGRGLDIDNKKGELKPCPFCGKEAMMFCMPKNENLPGNLWIVGCDGPNGSLCPCYIWKCTPFYVGKELAMKMWNKRA